MEMNKNTLGDKNLVNNLYQIRHSLAHVLAEAVLERFPNAKLAIGPPIEDGFYYDFELPRSLTIHDLDDLEMRMKKIIQGKYPFNKKVISVVEAMELFKDQPYKLEIIEVISSDEEISTFSQSKFTDLCRGPHVENTKDLDVSAFKLTGIAGAYWRGDEKRPMLQRIYGTAWETSGQLVSHLERLEEIEKRDHRKLGKELDLFSFQEQVGPGLVFLHPKGARIRSIIEDFWKKEHYQAGYELLNTPHIGREWLWKTSGHLDYFSENMYPPMELDSSHYYLKPMNCPFHIMIYKSDIRSYRDLPLRWAELGTVYRYERSGTLHGTLRVRGLTQDDAHIFCQPDQIEGEIIEELRFSKRMWNAYGFNNLKANLSTKPDKAVGNDNEWEQATNSLKKALEYHELDYEIDEGGGAFYGPKIDLMVIDPLGRPWQMTTIQFDFNLPDRFNMTFVDRDGSQKRPFMVHRALHGSIERFLGVLIEHYAGSFPMWLSPIQIVILSVNTEVNDYSKKIWKELNEAGFRVQVDLSDNRIGAKIRTAQGQKTPFMIILGPKELAGNTISIRSRAGEQNNLVDLNEALNIFNTAISDSPFHD